MPVGFDDRIAAASVQPEPFTAIVPNGVAVGESQRSDRVPVPVARAVTPVMPTRFAGSQASQSPASNEVTLRRPLAVLS